ncbi:MAG TPA: pyridoxamine 5'-phosphate oxidase family protein [Chitinophagaceae bacterium]|jgi:uncharacterized protein|nr:pyridoxamine 5'-phosphate oxidase family protein [Chitinophagaceae bacterium]
MNEHIAHFLQQQTCATICCIDEDGNPYCFTCYYAFNSEDGLLYFKSSKDAKHVTLLTQNKMISGTVLPDQLNKLSIKGIQFQGKLLHDANPMPKDAATKYYKKHPIANTIKGDVYTVCIDGIKMTDKNIGFGKKIIWTRNGIEETT